MKKILVATDFSVSAGNAMEYAMHVANVLKMEVCAIHAIGSTEGVFNNTYNAIYIEDYYKVKRQALSDWANAFKDSEPLKNVPVLSVCEVGSVSTVLTKYMADNDVELLVMGTTGSTGISGLFGGNTNTMLEKTKVPTLLIPLGSKFSTNPVITLASDFSASLTTLEVSVLNELIKAVDSKELTVVNVVEGVDLKTNEKGEKDLEGILPNVDIKFRYIKEDNPTEGIMNFIINNNTDILCVVKHHHNLIYRIFNKSTVNQVMNRSIKAMLVLHE
jgi:nucleotide-binding universal stress UspA family protein